MGIAGLQAGDQCTCAPEGWSPLLRCVLTSSVSISKGPERVVVLYSLRGPKENQPAGEARASGEQSVSALMPKANMVLSQCGSLVAER